MKGGETMLKWLDFLIISVLCCHFSNVPVIGDIAALFILAIGTCCIISDLKKPLER